MKRPPKKKHKNPLLPDDAQADERHLVDAEESADLSLEDRFQMYWMENRGFITGCITLLLVVVAGYQGLRLYMEHRDSRLQSEYAAAAAADGLEAFAREHPGAPLGGFAALRLGDEAFEAGDFATALNHYQVAVDGLGGTLLAGRARLGEAFALIGDGQAEAGRAALDALVADNSLPSAVRAEAAYHLAVQARADGDEARFASLAGQVESFGESGAWAQRLQYFREQAR